ncbi:MAG: hypothetical protein PHZ04_01685 [Patescibacteria group bacterium]|nr:hypothetical protein [Patescibacteria group bacterium]MDD5295162.1 hypothetical protein [Patescibacteria group bacterium]MDD5554776.1 hypothetical protein [Patescibacteria group bacterium]
MPNDFRQTVNLKEKPKPKAGSSRAEGIDNVFNDSSEEFSRINRPKIRKVNESLARRLAAVFALIAVLIAVYFLFLRKGGGEENMVKAGNWYAVKLVDEEIFYGQIKDTAADPVIIENVYYNYDQQKNAKTASETGNLRLVKRGGETHGPDGTMNIVRSQVLYMEPLKKDSKVLEAILNYEK